MDIESKVDKINSPDVQSAVEALGYLVPILEKYRFKWVITGGFAVRVYGVQRPITDIDIDIQTSKNNQGFISFMNEIKQYITQPLEHWVDRNYDNYNLEMVYQGQLVDICPMVEMKVYNKAKGKYVNFYQSEKFPPYEMVDFYGIKLPLLAKELIIKNKEMLVWQRESDRKDIEGLKETIENTKKYQT